MKIGILGAGGIALYLWGCGKMPFGGLSWGKGEQGFGELNQAYHMYK